MDEQNWKIDKVENMYNFLCLHEQDYKCSNLFQTFVSRKKNVSLEHFTQKNYFYLFAK